MKLSSVLTLTASLSASAYAQGPPQTYSLTPYPTSTAPYALAVGDLNLDGHPDVVTTSETGAKVSVLLGNGAGALGPKTDFTVNPKPYAVAIGEFNGDKLPDVVTANNTTPGTVSVLAGTGTGLLNPATYYNTGTDTHPTGIAVGDVNGDGLADLVTANGEGDSVSFLPATGTFGFGAAVVLPVTPSVSTTYFVSSVAIGDFNQDGLNDLVATANILTVQTPPPGSFVLFLATAPGVFAPAVLLPSGGHANSIAVYDVDQDGFADLVMSLYTADPNAAAAEISVVRGAGGGLFWPPTTYGTGKYPTSIAIGDVNGDAKVDVVTADFGTFGAVGNSISIYHGDGLGAFNLVSSPIVGSEPRTVVMGDLDRNGKLDLLTANLSGNSVTVLLNTTPDPTGVLPFGHGTWGCDGQLGLNANSTPNVGNAGFALKGSNAPRVSLGLLLVGDGLDFAGSDYFGINILLHVSFPLSSQILASNAYSGPAGEQFSPSPIPSNPNLVGLAFYCQTVWIEPPSRVCSPGVIGLESSRGLQLYIQP